MPADRLLLVVALVFGLTGPAIAASPTPSPPSPTGPPGVSAQPAANSPYRSKSGSLLELGSVRPGQVVRDVVVLRNIASVPQDVLVYVSDAIPANGGGFAFKGRGEPETQLGRWASLGLSRVTVPASGTSKVPFTLRLPAQVQGGEYVGGVIVEPAVAAPGAGLQTVTRYAMAVYLTVPGAAPGATPGRGKPSGKLRLTHLTVVRRKGLLCPTIDYTNDSQLVLDPSLTVEDRGLLGRHSYAEKRAGAVLPDGAVRRSLPCVKRPIGPSRLRIQISSPRGDGERVVPTTWLPMSLLIALLLLLLLLGALTTHLARGARKRPTAPGSD